MGFLSKIRDVVDPIGSKLTRKVDKKLKKELGFDPEDPFGWEQKIHNQISDKLGWDFDQYNFKQLGKELWKKPGRALVGSIDPLSTKMWNEISGRDDDPLVNQLGGPPKHRYQEFVDQGGDPGVANRAATAHQIAATIASIYAGGALGALAPGAGAAAGAGAGAGAAGGATAGAAAGTVAGGLASAIPAGSTFMAGLSGYGGAATAAIGAGAAEADALFDEELELEEQVPMGALGSLRVGNVPTWGYGAAQGGLMRAAQPRRRYGRRR